MRVAKIEVKVELDDGRSADVVFVRKDKIDAIMSDSGDFGKFCRSIVASIRPKSTERTH